MRQSQSARPPYRGFPRRPAPLLAGVGTLAMLVLLAAAVVIFRRRQWAAFFCCVFVAVFCGYAAWFPDAFIHSLVWIGRSPALAVSE